jgi:hypothetical protein
VEKDKDKDKEKVPNESGTSDHHPSISRETEFARIVFNSFEMMKQKFMEMS